MPANKRQHYVPKCHFKPFSLNAEGAAINLFNLGQNQGRQNVAIKGQCAKDYLYGEDLALERQLSAIEGEYGRILKLVLTNQRLTEQDLFTLRGFVYLQYSRTDMAITRYRQAQEGLLQTAFEGRPELAPEMDLTDRTMMREAMRIYDRTAFCTEDLKVCIVENRTSADFVTSDDPAIHTNRFHLQRLRKEQFGLESAGATLVMPLSPRHAFIAYDGAVYTMSDKIGDRVIIKRESDILAFNELQYLNAANNLYFSDWSGIERVSKEFEAASARRPKSRVAINAFVLDRRVGDREWWRKATADEIANGLHEMVHTSPVFPVPAHWFTKMTVRPKPESFSNGSAAGEVRRSAWLRRGLPL